MGLDMYLYKRNKKTDELTEIGYWRKHNALHGFMSTFTDHEIENLEHLPLTKDNLEEILELAEAIVRKDLAPESAMPTTEGFFYGSYEYDEWYFHRMEDTIKIMKGALTDINFDEEEAIYQAWW